MIDEVITADEKKFLLKKVTMKVLLGLFLLMVPFAIAMSLEFGHLRDLFLFVLSGYVLAGIWFYFMVSLVVKSVTFYSDIFRNKVKKLTAEFVVIDKEKITTTFEIGSDSQWFYLQLSAEKIVQPFRLDVNGQDYAIIHPGDFITLHYYSGVNHLLSAKYLGRELRSAKLNAKKPLHLLVVLRNKFQSVARKE